MSRAVYYCLHRSLVLPNFVGNKTFMQVRQESFRFKKFGIDDRRCGMKVGTDGVVLGAWVNCDAIRRALDIGAGSGLISLMLAQRGVDEIDAVEIDSLSAMDARENIAASPWSSIIRVQEISFTDFMPREGYDLIVSNPPFFGEGETAPDERRALARHEGLLNYSTLIDYSTKWLTPNGRLAFIYPYGREDEIIYKAEMSHLKLRRICYLRQRHDRPFVRTMFEFSRIDGPIETSELTIRENASNQYTAPFAELCKEFYLEL